MDTNTEIIEILSPFRNAKNPDDNNSSIGSKVVSDEAHYFYPFAVNPCNYDIYSKVIPEFIGYTKEAYNKFKSACLVAATAYNTNSKLGCENEFAIFIECKENSKLYLANLDQYITFIKGEKGQKDVIDLTNLTEILNKVSNEIEKIDLYYNDYTINIKGINDKYTTNKLF